MLLLWKVRHLKLSQGLRETADHAAAASAGEGKRRTGTALHGSIVRMCVIPLPTHGESVLIPFAEGGAHVPRITRLRATQGCEWPGPRGASAASSTGGLHAPPQDNTEVLNLG